MLGRGNHDDTYDADTTSIIVIEEPQNSQTKQKTPLWSWPLLAIAVSPLVLRLSERLFYRRTCDNAHKEIMYEGLYGLDGRKGFPTLRTLEGLLRNPSGMTPSLSNQPVHDRWSQYRLQRWPSR
jgi:hypothetical protein